MKTSSKLIALIEALLEDLHKYKDKNTEYLCLLRLTISHPNKYTLPDETIEETQERIEEWRLLGDSLIQRRLQIVAHAEKYLQATTFANTKPKK
eukprot:scaffold27015_cov51-Attheya_sp.AAC.1